LDPPVELTITHHHSPSGANILKVLENPFSAHLAVCQWRAAGQSIGLVPTMGALHQGHLELVRRSTEECDRTVVTIFVNPTQFGPGEDFSRYPRTLNQDLELLSGFPVDLVFTPSQQELYPPGFSTYVHPPELAATLEGTHRPGHFRGVATVVLKLFHILPASTAYFGQKDYQQLSVIRRMVRDLDVPIVIQGCPTVRESDGLAMSSRNRYLSADQRPAALGLYSALQSAQQMLQAGERGAAALEGEMREVLFRHGVDEIDYARVVDAETLAEIDLVQTTAVALIAAKVGNTRLIDNLLLVPSN
jgi:pantoate--beta-alanine ligase